MLLFNQKILFSFYKLYFFIQKWQDDHALSISNKFPHSKTMTRYYGLYARHRESDGKLRRAVPGSRRRILLDFNKWRQLLLLSFGYDPLHRPRCSHKMSFLELCHKHKPVPLEKLYERAMAGYRCRSSGKTAWFFLLSAPCWKHQQAGGLQWIQNS